MVLAGSLCVVSIVVMLRAETLRMTVIGAACAVCFGIATGLLKRWFFTHLNRNQVLREIKRLELGVALLSEKLDQAAAPDPDTKD